MYTMAYPDSGKYLCRQFLYLVFFFVVSNSESNIVKDGDFEAATYPTTDWSCNGHCKITSSTSDKINGSQSLKVTHRKQKWEGPAQEVKLDRNTGYHAVLYVKQLNSKTGTVFQTFKMHGQITVNSGTTIYPDFVVDQRVYPEKGWIKLESYFKTPDISYVKFNLVIMGPDGGIDFLVDDFSISKVEEEPNWKNEADKRIDQHRKNDIHFRVDIPSNTNPHDYTVAVKLNKHAFAFGSKINTDRVLENEYKPFQDLYYYMFNWATLANFYWKWASKPWDHPDHTLEVKAIKHLHEHGIPVRGHNIFWGRDKYLPPEVMKLSSEELKNMVDERIRIIVNYTKGMIDHWDVNNEMLHNHYFEEKTGNANFSHHMFSYLHQLDPKAKLFLNEYGLVNDGAYVSAFVRQAKEYRNAKVGLYGLGVQGHFHEYQKPNPTLIKKRLDQIAAAGYPIWITELDTVVADENTRAEWYDIILRMLFSHPAVEGIIFWGFYGPNHWRGPNAGLVSGLDYRVNTAGKHYLNLIYDEWSTHYNQNLGNGKIFTVRGFHGDYEVIVKYKGTAIKDQKFSLEKVDKTVNILITDLNARPNISTTPAPMLNEHGSTENHKIVKTGDFSLGTTTSSDSAELDCKTMWSALSKVGDDEHVDAVCPVGYILTGCTSVSNPIGTGKDGESIIKGTPMICRAYNGAKSSNPVQAVARCCKKTGLTCDYRQSHPSPKSLNVQVETPCQQHMFPTGCSSHNARYDRAGAFPTKSSCISQNYGYADGVVPFAICCKASAFHCIVKKSNPTDVNKGDSVRISCDNGYTMTGCQSFSEDAGLAATSINNNICTVTNGAQKMPGMNGVTAFATCCK